MLMVLESNLWDHLSSLIREMILNYDHVFITDILWRL